MTATTLSRYAAGGGRRGQRHPTAADGVARWCGRTPSHGWLFQDASGGCVASFGGINITEVAGSGSVTYQQATPYPNKYRADFNNAGSTFMSAGSNFQDDGATSYAWLFHAYYGTPLNLTRYSIGRHDGTKMSRAGTNTSGHILWHTHDGTTENLLTIAVDHTSTDTWVWCSVDRTAALKRVASRNGSGSVDITGQGAYSPVSIFRVNASIAENELAIAALYRFEGANAEGDPAETMRRIQRYQGGY